VVNTCPNEFLRQPSLPRLAAGREGAHAPTQQASPTRGGHHRTGVKWRNNTCNTRGSWGIGWRIGCARCLGLNRGRYHYHYHFPWSYLGQWCLAGSRVVHGRARWRGRRVLLIAWLVVGGGHNSVLGSITATPPCTHVVLDRGGILRALCNKGQECCLTAATGQWTPCVAGWPAVVRAGGGRHHLAAY
jgi:hypothetical protein